jgi:tripartite-type tricarboxylate transporter receptor subunit TctC
MTFSRRRFLHLAAGACTATVAVGPRMAWAQTYPMRPVRVIVPWAAGGPTDVFARLATQKLSERLGKQFYVENIPGANGNIGTGQAAKAAPDGHTMLMTVNSFVISPSFFDKVPYDPYKDFEPVTLAVDSTNVLVVNSSVPATTVKELIALIRANPSKYSFALGGGGGPSYLAGESMRLLLGLDIVQVPYNGGGPVIAAMVAGHAPISFATLAPAAPHIQAGNLRALAVMSKTRAQSLLTVPTIAEAGYPEIKGDAWVGVFVPARTPKQIVNLLNREIASFVTLTDIKDRLAAVGFEPVANTPEEFADRIKDDFEVWGKLIRAVHLNAG